MSMASLTAWYERQSARDQRVLQIGAAAVVIILLAAVFLMPRRAVEKAHTTLETRKELLSYMRQVGPSLVASGAGAEVQPITESFIVFIDRTAREHGLADAITGSPPAGNGTYRVTLEGADFNLLLNWVYQLASRHGVKVESANVTGTSGPGRVNASVQLRPPA